MSELILLKDLPSAPALHGVYIIVKSRYLGVRLTSFRSFLTSINCGLVCLIFHSIDCFGVKWSIRLTKLPIQTRKPKRDKPVF